MESHEDIDPSLGTVEIWGVDGVEAKALFDFTADTLGSAVTAKLYKEAAHSGDYSGVFSAVDDAWLKD